MLPKLLIISETIRRDLHAPMRLFGKFEIIHLYSKASYGDMKESDFNAPVAIRFNGGNDLLKKIKEIKPQIIQTAEPWANKTAFIIALTTYQYAKNNPVKIVMPSFENIPLANKISSLKQFLCQWIMARLDRYVSVYFVLNSGAQKNLEALGINRRKFSRLMWASWGINLNEFKFIPQKSKIKNQKSKILFLGRVSVAKGIPQLLQMFEIVKKEISAAKLTIAGPPGDASHLISKMHIPGMELLGVIKNTDVADYFNSGAVTVMPSQSTKQWEEQVGMVGLQSLACGTPVITTTSGAIPEYFKNNQGAFLFSENDVVAMAKTCVKLLSDQHFRQNQSQKGLKYVKDNYDINDNIKKIEDFLCRLK